VSTDTLAQDHAGPHDVSHIRKVAMWVFLGSEVLLFGSLITTFLLYRTRIGDGPGAEEVFDIPFTSVSSFILLMSSLTMVMAHHSAASKDWRQMRVWLVATGMLGIIFLSGQVFEFTEFVEEGLTVSTSPFGSSFFLLTGFHGVHVAATALMSFTGRLREGEGMNVEIIGLYWHFVDIVWIVIFTVVYLMQV